MSELVNSKISKEGYFHQKRVVFEGSPASNGLGENLTCLRVSKKAVIDAGTLPYSKDDSIVLEHIFISHSHLDHILGLAFYVDNNFYRLEKTVNIYGTKETIENLQNHFFNNKIWPDFTKIKLKDGVTPSISLNVINLGDKIELESEDVTLEPVPSYHMEGSCGFIVSHKGNSIYFTSDTKSDPRIAELINSRADIKQVIVDVSYTSDYNKLANDSSHMTPEILKDFQKLVREDVIFHIYHLKPNQYREIIKDIEKHGVLKNGGMILHNGTSIPYDISDAVSDRKNLNNDEKLDELFKCFTNAAKEKDPEKVVSMLGNMVRSIICADRCSFWLVDDDKKHITARVADGADSKKLQVEIGKGIVGKCILLKQEILENDPYSNSDFNKESDRATGYLTKSIISVPVYGDDKEKPIGAFQALNKLTTITNAFCEEDLDYVRLAADYAGKIYEAVKLNKEIDDTQKEIILAVAGVIEGKSNETGRHVHRVAQYSKVIAKALKDKNDKNIKMVGEWKFTDNDISYIEFGAPMHDLGKIAIPEAILNKPGRHTEEEFKIMKTHSTEGYKMLNHSERPFMKAAAVIAHEHHEKYGGGGYPRGIKGDKIHPYARIVALADAFDAMVSKRCYKEAYSLDDTFAEILRCRGGHFDPDVVDVFLENKEKFVKIFEQLKDV